MQNETELTDKFLKYIDEPLIDKLFTIPQLNKILTSHGIDFQRNASKRMKMTQLKRYFKEGITGNNDDDSIVEGTTILCGICLEEKIPYVLICGHTYCKSCLSKLKRKPVRERVCPSCRKPFHVFAKVILS